MRCSLGRYEDAISHYKAVEIQSDNLDVWYQRGIALVKLQQYEDALPRLIKPELKPDDPSAGISEALL